MVAPQHLSLLHIVGFWLPSRLCVSAGSLEAVLVESGPGFQMTERKPEFVGLLPFALVTTVSSARSIFSVSTERHCLLPKGL